MVKEKTIWSGLVKIDIVMRPFRLKLVNTAANSVKDFVHGLKADTDFCTSPSCVVGA